MEELRQLEHLSLVSKICTELENHLGLNDKDLAEFIIDLAQKNTTFDKFKAALERNGAEFDDSFISNLLRLIQHMQPKKRDAAGDSKPTLTEKDILRQKLPALAIPDDPGNRLMAEFANLIPVWKKEVEIVKEKTKEEKSRRRDDGERKRHRRESASRSRSRSPRGNRRRGDRSRSRDRDSRHRRRSRSGGGKNRSRSADDRRGNRREFRRPVEQIDDEPVVGKIYEGRVTNVRDFGCFVQLNGIRKRMEGLVHISQLKDQRVAAVSDVVNRGQKVSNFL